MEGNVTNDDDVMGDIKRLTQLWCAARAYLGASQPAIEGASSRQDLTDIASAHLPEIAAHYSQLQDLLAAYSNSSGASEPLRRQPKRKSEGHQEDQRAKDEEEKLKKSESVFSQSTDMEADSIEANQSVGEDSGDDIGGSKKKSVDAEGEISQVGKSVDKGGQEDATSDDDDDDDEPILLPPPMRQPQPQHQHQPQPQPQPQPQHQHQHQHQPVRVVSMAKPRNAKIWNKDIATMIEDKKIKKDKSNVKGFFASNQDEGWKACLEAVSAENAKEIFVSESGHIVGLPDFMEKREKDFCEGVIRGNPEIYLSPAQRGYLNIISMRSGAFGILMSFHNCDDGSVYTTEELQQKASNILGFDVAPKMELKKDDSKKYGICPWTEGIKTLEGHGLVSRTRRGQRTILHGNGLQDTFSLTKDGKIFLHCLIQSRGDEVMQHYPGVIEENSVPNRTGPGAQLQVVPAAAAAAAAAPAASSSSAKHIPNSTSSAARRVVSESSTAASVNSTAKSTSEDTSAMSSSVQHIPNKSNVVRRNTNVSASASEDIFASDSVLDIPVGEVGYKFEKNFPGYGVYQGEVVEIRPGAEGGKDRRCRYEEDGDVEDLRLEDLQKLARKKRHHRPSSTDGRSNKRRRR